MEPARCFYCLPVYHWNSFGGNRRPGLPDKPHHHQGDEGPEDRQGPQAA